MKLYSPLALLTIFCSAASAFGLNGRAQSVVKTNKNIAGLAKQSPLVQPVDINGNRLNTVVS